MNLNTTFSLLLILYSISGRCQQYELDPDFGSNGIVATPFDGSSSLTAGHVCALQNDGGIIVGGVTSQNMLVLRYTTTGLLDSTFSEDGFVETDFFGNDDRIADVEIQTDGKIVVVGTIVNGSGHPEIGLVRYNTDGTLDNTFGGDGKVHTAIGSPSSAWGYALKILPSGKILVIADFYILRYEMNGNLDLSFGTNGKIFVDYFTEIRSLTTEPDGNILLVGASTFTWLGNFYIARIDTNGVFDNNFGIAGEVLFNVCPDESIEYRTAHSVLSLENGNILVGGNCENKFAILRLFSNGQVDSTFGIDGVRRTALFSSDSDHQSLALQDDDKIIVGGKYGKFSILRLNSDGSVDSTLNQDGIYSSTLNDDPDYLIMQTDHKIIQVGASQNGVGLVRYREAIAVNVTIPKPEPLSDIEVYPNPSSGDLYLSYNLLQDEKLSINIQSFNGSIVAHLAVNEWRPQGENQAFFQLEKLPGGIYTIQIIVNNNLYHTRFIKID